MTTPTEAMRLALDALTLTREQLAGDRLELIACHAWPAGSGEIPEHDRAGTQALREYDECISSTESAITALRDALAAAPQPATVKDSLTHGAQQGEAVAQAMPQGWDVDDLLSKPTKPAAAPQPVAQGDDYGSVDFGFTFAGIPVTDGDKRLLALVTRALGNDHSAFTDLMELVMAARSKAAAPAGVVGEPVARVVRLPGRYSNPKVEWIDGAAVRIGMELFAAPPARQALTDERLQAAGLDYALADALGSGKDEWSAQDIADAFKAGARSAERYYGIGGKGEADHG